MRKILAAFLVLAVLTRLSTQQEKQKFCGRRLTNALSLLCVNGFLLEKRGAPEVEGELAMGYGWPWGLDARPFGRTARSRRMGIIKECCDNPCSIDQLVNYCRPVDA